MDMPAASTAANLSPPRAKVLNRLKRGGPQDADALARALGVTAMAVRQHLYVLAAAGLVAFTEEAPTRGRPAKLWRATERGDPYFPDAHAALGGELIGTAPAVFGGG